MRLWVWITGMLEGIWLALRQWRQQTKAEDEATGLAEDAALRKLLHCGKFETTTPNAVASVGGKRRGGFVVKRNRYTVWFQLYDGNIIKRHIRKHFVVETAW